MKFVSGGAIKQELKSLRPKWIAVAYVGYDWAEYVDEDSVKIIILSPTLGSNPAAIAAIAGKIGWGNVYFLNELHAKMFIGEQAGFSGSANLSTFGLSGQHLQEAGFSTEDATQLEQMRAYFDKLRMLAQDQYPRSEDKEERLAWLLQQRDAAKANKLIAVDPVIGSILDYQVVSDRDFYVCWYRDDGATVLVDEDAVSSNLVGNGGISLDTYIADWTHFRGDDKIESNRWILFWRADSKGLPSKAIAPYWLYINDLVSGTVDSPYSTLAAERRGGRPGPPPFGIESNTFQRAFGRALMRPEFSVMRDHGEHGDWLAHATFPVFSKFISAIKEEIRSAIAP